MIICEASGTKKSLRVGNPPGHGKAILSGNLVRLLLLLASVGCEVCLESLCELVGRLAGRLKGVALDGGDEAGEIEDMASSATEIMLEAASLVDSPPTTRIFGMGMSVGAESVDAEFGFAES